MILPLPPYEESRVEVTGMYIPATHPSVFLRTRPRVSVQNIDLYLTAPRIREEQ